MTPIRFTKLHGLGNDFLVVDVRGLPEAAAKAVQDPENVRRLCDRPFGVGGDGVLAVRAPVTAGAVAEMRVINADGSIAEMCGNGIRCVAKVLWEAGAKGDQMIIDTGAGPLACGVSVVDGTVDAVTVDMGRPRLTRAEIPMTGPGGERCVEQAIAIPGDDPAADRRVTAVSMGNPHAVIFVDDRDELMRLAETAGPGLERHPYFPNRTNAEWAHVVSPTEIDLVVWERGVGITLACGTGACATAVAACLTGRAEAGTEITVRLPGGPLAITVAADYSTVHMRGPARRIFEAELDLDSLASSARP